MGDLSEDSVIRLPSARSLPVQDQRRDASPSPADADATGRRPMRWSEWAFLRLRAESPPKPSRSSSPVLHGETPSRLHPRPGTAALRGILRGVHGRASAMRVRSAANTPSTARDPTPRRDIETPVVRERANASPSKPKTVTLLPLNALEDPFPERPDILPDSVPEVDKVEAPLMGRRKFSETFSAQVVADMSATESKLVRRVARARMIAAFRMGIRGQRSAKGCSKECAGQVTGTKNVYDVMALMATQGHHTWVLSLCVSDDGRHLFTGSFAAGPISHTDRSGAYENAFRRAYLNPGTLREGANPILMWDMITSEVVGHFFGHRKTVSALAVSSDDRLLFSGADDRSLRIWSVDTRECLYELTAHPAQVSCIALYPPNASFRELKYVFSAGGSENNDKLPEPDNRIRKWRMPVYGGVDLPHLPHDSYLDGHTAWVRALVLCQSGKYLWSASNDGTILKFDALEGAVPLVVLRGHGNFDEDISSSGLWNEFSPPPAAGKVEGVPKDPRFHWVRGLALDSDSDGDGQGTLYSVGNDWTMRAWDTATGKQLFRYEAHEDKVSSVALGMGCIFTSSNDGWMHQWYPRRAHPVCSFSAQNAIACMAVSPERGELLSALYDTKVSAWPARPWEELEAEENDFDFAKPKDEPVDSFSYKTLDSGGSRKSIFGLSSRSTTRSTKRGRNSMYPLNSNRKEASSRARRRFALVKGGVKGAGKETARRHSMFRRMSIGGGHFSFSPDVVAELAVLDAKVNIAPKAVALPDAPGGDLGEVIAGGMDQAHETLVLKPVRAYSDVKVSSSASNLIDTIVVSVQFLSFAFARSSPWSDVVKKPMVAIGTIVNIRLPRTIYWPGFSLALILMLYVDIVFFFDLHGVVVRYMEQLRLQKRGITLKPDFKDKTSVKRSGPVWLEDRLRVFAIVRVLNLLTGVLLVPLLHQLERVFLCEAASLEDLASFDPELGSSTGGAGTETPACIEADVHYWVPAWEQCIPCNKGWTTQDWTVYFTLAIVVPFVLVTLRLSTVEQDVSKLHMVPKARGVLRSHVFTSWFKHDEVAPTSCGPFSRDLHGGGAFMLHQTAGKVVAVVLNTKVRHHRVLLFSSLVLWAVWQCAATVIYRPFAAASLSRFVLVLRGIVLYAMVCALVMTFVPPDAVQLRALCTLASFVCVSFYTRAVWKYSAQIYDPNDPWRPSLLRSKQRFKTLNANNEAANTTAEDRVSFSTSSADNIKLFSGTEIIWSSFV